MVVWIKQNPLSFPTIAEYYTIISVILKVLSMETDMEIELSISEGSK